jgi:hypothetical protein
MTLSDILGFMKFPGLHRLKLNHVDTVAHNQKYSIIILAIPHQPFPPRINLRREPEKARTVCISMVFHGTHVATP